ncbi:MAG: methylenetetrahydrofolate reductase C-terminal domain-containing protein [Nitrospinota bacterium]
MIVTKQKPFEEILRYTEGEKCIYIIGCGECSAQCHTGGEEDIKDMKERLEGAGKEVVATTLIQAPCQELDTERILRKNKELVTSSEGILVLACGAGVQAVSEAVDRPVHSGCNSMFLGNIRRRMHFYEKCSMCGECVLNDYGGICPVTRCPKGLLNGPCGGIINGKCEVDSEKVCVWGLIYERMEEGIKADGLMRIYPPKNHGVCVRPGKIE